MSHTQRTAREQIERVWRQVHGHSESTSLGLTAKEWEFLETLLNATPISQEPTP